MWNEENTDQNVEQVWFAGCHSDVGGWYKAVKEDENDEDDDRSLSDIAFAWMMDKAFACKLKPKPDWEKNLEQNAAGKLHESWKDEWRFWLPKSREIPKGKTQEKAKIHQSVIDRIEQNENYRPKNLIKEYDLKELKKAYKVITNDTYENRPKSGVNK
jgi:hypothetical protein